MLSFVSKGVNSAHTHHDSDSESNQKKGGVHALTPPGVGGAVLMLEAVLDASSVTFLPTSLPPILGPN